MQSRVLSSLVEGVAALTRLTAEHALETLERRCKTPDRKASDVMMIGRRRRRAASTAASNSGFLGLPWQTVAMQGFAQCILSGLLALAAYSYAVTVLGASKASAFVS